ncbi:MAG TPA: glycogen debranching N-terminal domain-containing protein [Egibacteraceae bacterium]|nr:glycogen debranching N-terminal domain-containing protein [Egibacteraceae bacterium]
MADPWTTVAEPARLGQPEGVVTLVEGSSFAISDRSGDVRPGSAHGLFFLDTRFLSRLELTVDGHRPEVLGVSVSEPFAGTFVQQVRPERRGAGRLVIVRHRYVGRGMREDLLLRNYSPEPASFLLRLHLDVDFADLFEVKEGRVRRRGEYRQEVTDGTRFVFGCRRDQATRGAWIEFSQVPLTGPQVAVWELTIPGRGQWAVCMQVTPTIEESAIEPRYACGQPADQAVPRARLVQWRKDAARVETDHPPLASAVTRASEDLASLRMFDPEHPHRTVVAAGAPWFMTVFGRDSLLTAWMALLINPDLALGVLRTLADFQGAEVNPVTEEEPGRILHEMRFGAAGSLSLGGGSIYYGTIDATALFVMLLGEVHRWGLAGDRVHDLLPNADRALEWIERFGDRDGDGYVEYQRSSESGLANQGWKDSWDAIRFADGRLAEAPIALCEVQGYVYAAYLARAQLAEDDGDQQVAGRYRVAAAELKERFNRDFWLEQQGWFALGLDRDKRPIDALASNMGHCLWTGIVDADKAEAVAQRLLSPELFSGWGIRTLATSMAGFDPLSYHNGSVWPHDTALIAAGLQRYGFSDQAHQLMLALLDVAVVSAGRFPELLCGFARQEIANPVAYPTSCSPQAWASAVPLQLVRTMLGWEPLVSHGSLRLQPVLPRPIQRLRVENIPLAGVQVTVDVDGDAVHVEGLPVGLALSPGSTPSVVTGF